MALFSFVILVHFVVVGFLVIVSLHDRMVNPGPARAFAGLIKARLVELNSNCGHAAFMCDGDTLRGPVMDFLSEWWGERFWAPIACSLFHGPVALFSSQAV